MRTLFRLALALTLAATAALAAEERCPKRLAAADFLSFVEEEADEESRFLGDRAWTRERFEQTAHWIEPDSRTREAGNPVIYRGLFKQYQLATGINVTLRLRTELDEFLAEKGIPPDELEYLGSGVQGTLFTHPKLGNNAVKVVSSALQNGDQSVSERAKVALGRERRFVTNFHRGYDDLKAAESQLTDPGMRALYETTMERLKRSYRAQAKQALHRAQQLILPGLMAGQARLRYVDFARVTLIGNGFILREYYSDSVAENRGAIRSVLSAHGLTLTEVTDALTGVRKEHPVLTELGSALIAVPSFFVSPSLFAATMDDRRRLIVIFDLD